MVCKDWVLETGAEHKKVNIHAEAARFVKCGAQLWIDWGLEHQTCEFSKASRANWERTPLFLEGRDDEMIFKKADKTTLPETNIAP